MIRNLTILSILFLVWSSTLIAQSTDVGVKVGNNGNLSFTNKYKSGNYTELYHFGNGYQGGAYIEQRLFRGVGIRGEFSYNNINFEMDHDSHWPGEWDGKENYFYEEITVNSSAFNLAGDLVINLGRVSLGIGPEVSFITQANGRGARYYYADPNSDGRAQRLQYRFFANRKQVYNREDLDEKFAFDANRISYGLDINANIVVYKPFSIQAKMYYPMNEFVEEFVSFNNDAINQQTINLQLSVVYTFNLHQYRKGYRWNIKKKKRPNRS